MDAAATFGLDRLPNSFRQDVDSREPDVMGALSGAAWLKRLPHIVSERAHEWNLTPDGPIAVGTSAVVFPVRAEGRKAALKISWPHAEARYEHLALRAWNGHGSVKLQAAHPRDDALLLERCEPAEQVRQMSALDSAETVGELVHELIHPPLPQLDRASDWLQRIGQRLASPDLPLPRRFLDQGRSIARDLARDECVNAELVHTDLHDGNIMMAKRRGHGSRLVAIDPKPMNGERAMTLAPLIWNRWDEAANAYNLRKHLRFRIDYAAEPAGVDPARARAWTMVRLLDNAWWALQNDPSADMTRTVAMVKAMQG